jgi:membrane protein YqaA with SNARE-associated domain
MDCSQHLAQLAATHGPWALLPISFLAATLLPLSSELALAAALRAGADPLACLLAASTGNCAACALNYALGRLSRDRAQARLLASHTGRAALRALDRLGLWSLALSWLPILGDPLTLTAGVARVPLHLFLPIVASLRVARYLAILAPFAL